MGDEPEGKAEHIESEANYWAGKVVESIKERKKDVSEKEALNTLAILDADHNITDRMDSDDLDTFLDEFEGAVVEQEVNATEIQDRADEASGETVIEGKTKTEIEINDGK